MCKYVVLPPVPPRTKGNATKDFNGANTHKGFGYRMLWDLIQRLLSFRGSRAKKIESEAATLLIDFPRDCYGTHSSTSTECPTCPPGNYCREETIAGNERRAQKSTKNKLHEPDAGAAGEAYFHEAGRYHE